MARNEFSTEQQALVSKALESDSYDGDLDMHNDVVRTAETTDDFKRNGNWTDIKRGYFKAGELTGDLVEGYQYQKGDTRVKLMVLDFGDFRAVVEL